MKTTKFEENISFFHISERKGKNQKNISSLIFLNETKI